MRFVWKNDMSSHSGYILRFHQMLRLPRNVPLYFQLGPWFMLLCYSALVASLSYSALNYTILSYFSHLPVLFFELLYPAPLYSTSFYSTLLYPTSFYSTVLYLIHLNSMLTCFSLLCPSLLYSTLVCFCSSLLYRQLLGISAFFTSVTQKKFSTRLPLVILAM